MKADLEKTLLERLKEYSASDYYPLHMPGHKRRGDVPGMEFPNPFTIDITEIDGFDNLHHAEGILKESMQWAADIYGADESCYLVNGSSCGILSTVCGCTDRRGKILISRNCHKSVYHGVFLNELETEYVYPQIIPELGIQGGILPEDVEKQLKRHPDIQAVLIVSPTYDGIVSDVKRIAEVVHRYGIPLVVDEAHGAHFSFGRKGEFPVSALEEGADVVIQSLHKTLPSMTQTAILHMKGTLLGQRRERICRYLSIYQSSSPSYVLMASIENCIRYMNGKGRSDLSEFCRRLQDFRSSCSEFQNIRIAGPEQIGKNGVYDLDASKLLIMADKKSGVWLGDWMRQHAHLELEMCAPRYGLALTSLWDRKEGFERLKKALQELDEVLEKEKEREAIDWAAVQQPVDPERVFRISDAMEAAGEVKLLEDCKDEISAEFVYLYPPGIPYLTPGERISDEMILKLLQYRKLGLSIQGTEDLKGFRIRVMNAEK